MKTTSRICGTLLVGLGLCFSGMAEAKKGGSAKADRGGGKGQAQAVAKRSQNVAYRGSSAKRTQKVVRGAASSGKRDYAVAQRLATGDQDYVVAGRGATARKSIVSEPSRIVDRHRVVRRDRSDWDDDSRRYRRSYDDHDHRHYSGGLYLAPSFGFGYRPYSSYYSDPWQYGYSGYPQTYYRSSAGYYGYNAYDSSLAADVQVALAELGYYDGAIDGIFGHRSRQALFAFQEDSGLPVTGRIDSVTLAHLGLG